MSSSITPALIYVSRHARVVAIQYTAPMTNPTVHTDIAIIGGGVAGLWTLNQLRNRGYSAILFEHRALGSDQTIASQGMIHGGIKYALGGKLNADTEAIAAMPAAWRHCLAGEGAVDLRGCRVLSEEFYLWSTGSLSSRLGSFFASKMLRGRVEPLAQPDYPAPLQHTDFRGQVYRLVDLVLDVPSLLKTLVDRHQQSIFHIDWHQASLQRVSGKARLVLPQCTVEPQCLLLTAGAGNATLLHQLGASSPAMQRRPLQQVLVKHQYQDPLFAHCMGNSASPRLTISSHRTQQGEPVWYLGGDLATAGHGESSAQLIAKARRELAQLLPWVDLGQSEWRTLSLDRAEAKQAGLLRPDTAFVAPAEGIDNALVAWPTKLTLCPQLGDAIEAQLQDRRVFPLHQQQLLALQGLGHPRIATPCWDTLFQ